MEWNMEWNVEWIMDGSSPRGSCLRMLNTQLLGVVVDCYYTVHPADFDRWLTLITRVIQEPL